MMTKMKILDDLPRPKITDQIKGKRTKRPRPSSSTSSSGGDGGGVDQSLLNNSFLVSSNSSQSPTTSSTCTITDQEDEDMANCLILLARGGKNSQSHQEDNHLKVAQRGTSRKFTELTTFNTTSAKVGIYVYECKTCNRSFPSFQALGGHRASHKKPKQDNNNEDHLKNQETKPPVTNTTHDVISRPEQDQVFVIKKSGRVDHENKAKVHECSICGSEFASGQALGGHMRRHRSAFNGKGINGTSLGGNSVHESSSHDVSDELKPQSNNNINVLSLDLNLPAPSEDGIFLDQTAFLPLPV